ncbi:MAG: hypothetical protein IT379_04375 [Deltaproteobacteria bacterium]|nr:hypothetical protein [Deltaproteobacteria bacterium]
MRRSTTFAVSFALLVLSTSVTACEEECPDDQTTAVVLRILGAAALPADTTFDIAVFAHEQYELSAGAAPVVAEEIADFVEISDVSFVGEGVTVLVTPRCNDHCREFLARLSFRRRDLGDAVVATAWLETGYREESFTEFRWLVPDALVRGGAPCTGCAPDQTCRATEESSFMPVCEPIAIDRCNVPPLGSTLLWDDFREPGCSETCE